MKMVDWEKKKLYNKALLLMNVCIVLSKVGAPKHGYYHCDRCDHTLKKLEFRIHCVLRWPFAT